MPELPYHLVDVFTDRQFGGNQLAVFLDIEDLAGETMQQIARELNLSETTFVLPPDDPNNHYRVRIFTPAREMPMAGHPTVGTAYVLARQGRSVTHGRCSFRFEENIGLIPVSLEVENGQPKMIWMEQPLPTFGPRWENRHAIADMLSLSINDLVADLPVEVVSCGVPFIYVPLASLDAARRVRLRPDLWDQHLRDFVTQEIFVFTRETVFESSTVHSRMLAPSLGIGEDPATGAASGPLGAYLARYGMVGGNPATLVSEQGIEMGRPSFIHIEVARDGASFTRVAIGGTCVGVGEGVLRLR